jgi:hypothetical protein
MNQYKTEVAGLVDATGATTYTRGQACASALPGGAGTGVYTLTLGLGLDANELVPIITPGTAAAIVQFVDTSDTVKTVTFLDNAGAALDSSFYYALLRVAFGGH